MTSAVLVLAAAVSPLLAMVLPLSTAPVLVSAIVLGCAAYVWQNRAAPPVWKVPFAIVACALVWSAITLLWTLEPGRGAANVGKLVVLLFGGLTLAAITRRIGDGDRRAVAVAFLAAMTLALVLLAIEVFTDGVLNRLIRDHFGLPPFRSFLLNRPVTIFAVFLWPAAMAAYRVKGIRACAALLLAGSVVLVSTESTTAAVAVLFGLAAALLYAIRGGGAISRRLAAAMVIVATLGAPAYSLGLAAVGDREIGSPTLSSVMHRLYIWDFVAGKIREKPVAGWGLESSRSIPGGSKPHITPRDETRTEMLVRSFKTQLLPLHPHNGGLQVWLELGLPGILMFTALVLWGVRAIGRQVPDSCFAALCTGQLVCTFVIAELAYGIWQSWWVSTILIGTVMSAAFLPAAGDQPAAEG